MATAFRRPPLSGLLTDKTRLCPRFVPTRTFLWGGLDSRLAIALPVTPHPNGGRRTGYGACRRDPLAPAAPPAARDCDFAVSSCCSRSSATRSVQALCARGADHKFGASLRCAACGHDPSAGAAPPTLRDCHLLTPPRIVQVADARQDQAQLMGRREREGGRPKGRRVGARRRDGPPISLHGPSRLSRFCLCRHAARAGSSLSCEAPRPQSGRGFTRL